MYVLQFRASDRAVTSLVLASRRSEQGQMHVLHTNTGRLLVFVAEKSSEELSQYVCHDLTSRSSNPGIFLHTVCTLGTMENSSYSS
jgi:hypothetical protein